ncbi:L-glutamate gamma-semialdehyde dehydrogenase [Oligoflexia bacterium]|nr:L-glutamate gamma-semialdehyde dehydrogenase [Oligoflexia bacterium]
MFKNEVYTDFSIQKNRDAFQAVLDDLEDQVKAGTLYAAPIIGGKESGGKETVDSIDPGCPEVVLGKVRCADSSDAEAALASLNEGLTSWRATPFEKRAQVLKTAAKLMRERKHEISALMVREAGKPWAEADGDTAEGIDFCEFYADEMMRLGPRQEFGDEEGEKNYYFYQPRGVGVVISPWNFPFAIAAGMTVAGLVTGNVVVLKPSMQTCLVGHKLAQILLEAGVPGDAFAYLPGRGSVIGNYLVESPKVDYVCFTGSREVGLGIINKASVVHTGQRNVKKVIAEMGGKNGSIVDCNADLEEAVKGVMVSAFGYAGQKCSACSRAIIVDDLYDEFMMRLVAATAKLTAGQTKDGDAFLPPVIDNEAYQRILSQVEKAEQDHTLVFKGELSESSGYFVPAMIFGDVDRTSWLLQEELFAPVLACVRAKDFDDALAIANDTEYALTGGVFSTNPEHIKKACQEFRVGNLYINRKQTGAMVYRQPFGGFKMSGVGSKAGGPDYLIQFMEPRTVTENTAC